MSDNLFGVYKAIITDITPFKITGKVRAKISVFNSGYVGKDLLDNYNSNYFAEFIERDTLVNIMMPFGGGANYGMFTIPPVNSVGLVIFLDGNEEFPVWIGGLSSNIFSLNGDLLKSNYPSDDIYSDKTIIETEEGSNTSEVMSESLGSFVIKTKTNKLEDLNNPETMNWENNPTENGIVLNENRMEFAHISKDGYTQNITLKSGDDFDIKISSGDSSNVSNIIIKKDEIVIQKKNEEGESSISLSPNGNSLIFKRDNEETSIKQSPKGIEVKNDMSEILLKKTNLSDEVIINSPVVRISSKSIVLGNGDFRIVTSPSDFNLTLEDGTLLTTAKNVRI